VATKKQRRRREKGRRHEYEFVYVDEEGQEVEVDEPEPKPKPRKAEEQKAKAKPAAKNAPRAARVVEPPTWNRVFRRAAIFAPLMLIFLYIARPKGVSTTAIALQALFVVAILILFMYVVDSLLYRSYQKRMDKRGGSPPKSK
jgi:hypothetical protein